MDITIVLIQVLFWIPFACIALDILHQSGIEEFLIEEFERIWLGDCTPIRYFDCLLEEPDK